MHGMDVTEAARKHGREKVREKRMIADDLRKTVSSSEDEEQSPRATSPSLLEGAVGPRVFSRESERGSKRVALERLEVLEQRNGVLEQRNGVLEQQVAFLYRAFKLDQPGKGPPPTVAPSEPDPCEQSPPRMSPVQLSTLKAMLEAKKPDGKVT